MADSHEITHPEGAAADEGREADRFWTLANVFSLLRIPLIMPVIWLIASGLEYRWYLFWVVMLIICTDILDGTFARRRGQITEWGKILDPLADKLAIDFIAVSLIIFRELPVWVGVVVIGRDVVIVLAGIFLITSGKVVVPSNIWGKLTTLVMSVLLLSYGMDWEVVKVPLLATAAFLLAASSVSYGVHMLRTRRTYDGSEPEANESQRDHSCA